MARPEVRQLPSLGEWLAILWYTSKQHWSPSQQRILQAAGRHYWKSALWLACFLAAFAGLGSLVWNQVSIGVACMPMWEWVHPQLEWLNYVDLMLCPTWHTYLQMTDWKYRYGFGWETTYVPCPIDIKRFRFRPRQICRRFLFINGWGGGTPTRLDGSPVEYSRKGLERILQAARLEGRLSFIVYSLAAPPDQLPANIEWRHPPADNADLYLDGDICVQPSHYEGIGLQLLECQAAGLPLVTTGAPPMNEYNPMRIIISPSD